MNPAEEMIEMLKCSVYRSRWKHGKWTVVIHFLKLGSSVPSENVF